MSKVTDISTGRQWAPCNHQDMARIELFIRQEAAYSGLDANRIDSLVCKYVQFAGSMPMGRIRRDILREIDGERV